MKYKTSSEDIEYPLSKEKFRILNRKNVRVACPCCGTVHNTMYKRSIYKSVLKALILLYRHNNAATPNSIGDFTKLSKFGLVEKVNYGCGWAVTEYGEMFIKGNASIPKWVYLRNNDVKGFSDDRVFIGDIK